ncbi:acyl-CoA dehydrogenase family protein [Pseudonocardia xishanensis]
MTTIIDAPQQTTTQAAPDVAQKWVEVARSLAPLVESERRQGDEDTVVTTKLVQAWRQAGLYRLLQPSHHGGEGLDNVSYLRVAEEVSRQDASAGWVFGIHIIGTLFPGILLPADSYRELVGSDGGGTACGFAFGKIPGTAKPVDGGYLVQSEPMPFGSGTQRVDRVASALYLLDENGDNVLDEAGNPVVVNAYMDPENIEWLNNWQAAGLRGSGSGHYRVKEHVLESKWLSNAPGERPSGAIFATGFFPLVHMHHTGVALGVAKRAIEEIAKIAKGRRRGDIASLDEHPVFQHEFIRVDAEYRAARALVFQAYREIWAAAEEGTVTEVHSARVEQADLHLHRVLREIVSTVSVWAGSEAIPDGGVIARLNADTSVAVNHLALSPHQSGKIAPHLLEAARVESAPGS